MLEKNKEYLFKELVELSKIYPEIKKIINKHNVKISPKNKIYKFEDFDNETKNIYLNIAQEIKKYNTNQKDLQVSAVGSRIKGYWKTKEESEQIAKNLNLDKIKYSDYDIMTNAKNIPDLNKLAQKLNVCKIDLLFNHKKFVDIPLN